MTKEIQKKPLVANWETKFQFYTGHSLENFRSITKFTEWLHRPVDAAALGVFRMLFGIAMLIDIVEERGGSQMDVRFGDPKTCHFPLLNFIQAQSLPVMGVVYLIMWFGALGIALGYKYKLSCLAFVVPYWYLFLLDKPAWNNHSYLFGLCGVLLTMTNANRYCSFDYFHSGEEKACVVPYWNYFLIKFQFFVLYAYAGLKKFSTEWLSGYAMSSLGHHWLFTPFRSVLSVEMTDLLIIHWFTAIFDFSIAFFMTYHKTRNFATPFMMSFHLMNSRLFSIGMFPWVCLAEVPLFFGFDWPHKIMVSKSSPKDKNETNDTMECEHVEKIDTLPMSTLRKRKPNSSEPSPTIKQKPIVKPDTLHSSWTKRLRTIAILAYCGAQLFLPYSHFITKGYNNWTQGLYGYSWDMMVHSYDTVLTSVKVVDNKNGNLHYLEPYAFTQYDRWTKSADMAVQYAKCIHRNIATEMARNPRKSPLSSANISIYFDIWCSMNGRFQQRVFNPTVDLLTARWSPFEQTSWSLPVLNELNYMRPKLKSITDDVLSWSNYSDVIFVADFPGLTLENFVSPDLNNVTLTVIDGSVVYRNESFEKHLKSGQSMSASAGKTHFIKTTSMQPSCYMYTYVNKTMEKLQEVTESNPFKNSYDFTQFWNELTQRIDNYKTFLYHVFNSLMFLVYGVPMPISIREV